MEYKVFIENLAKKAGGIIKNNFSLNVKHTIKEDSSVLTKADIEINDLVIDTIEKNFPEHSILGEEKSKIKQSEYTWVCDPIDGTLPLVLGMPNCVFSLALTYKGTPIAAGVLDPFLDRFYYSEKNKGAFVNDMPLKTSKREDISNAYIAISYITEQEQNIQKAINHFYKNNVWVLNYYAVIHNSVLVAAGKIDAAIFSKNKPEDGAAIKLIVEEAGGKVTSLRGEEQRYDREIQGYLASNGLIHEELLKILNS